jgi:putative transposase
LGNSKQERLANYRSLFESRVDGDLLTEVRHALNKGLVLGTEKFRSEVETISGQRLRHLKPGPKPTKKR